MRFADWRLAVNGVPIVLDLFPDRTPSLESQFLLDGKQLAWPNSEAGERERHYDGDGNLIAIVHE